MPNRTIQLGDDTVTVEEFSGRKAARAIKLFEGIVQQIPDIAERYQQYQLDYRDTHFLTLTPSQARLRFPPVPLLNDAGDAVFDADGALVMVPSSVDRMTDADWAEQGGVLKLPRSPTAGEALAHLLPQLIELAEGEVGALIALVATPNADVKKKARDGTLRDYLEQRGDDLLDAPISDLIALGDAAFTLTSESLKSKVAQQTAAVVGPLMRMVGIQIPGLPSGTATPTPSSVPSSPSSATSSNGSQPSTDGTSAPSSTAPAGVS